MWPRLIAFALAILAITLGLTKHSEIAAFLSSMGDIGPGHSDDEKTWGLIAFSLSGLLIVAVVAIIARTSDDRERT